MSKDLEENKPQYMGRMLHELTEEIARLRGELGRVERSLIAERVKGVEKALAQHYLVLYADQAEENIDEDVEHMVRRDCDQGDRCKQHFKNSLQEPLEACKREGAENALRNLDAKLRQVEKTVKTAANTPCEPCHRELKRALQKQRKGLQRIADLKSAPEKKEPDKPLNIPYLVQCVLEPLDHPTRLAILETAYQGRKSFSELSKITGTKGGHLIFHLSKLVRSGLIAQDGKKGDYVITSRGIDLIRKLLSIQSE